MSQNPFVYVKELPEVELPVFPDREFVITDFGAVGDGLTMNTEAINKAIEACSNAGGGKVIIPAGIWKTGPIILKSNVNLHIEKNALVLFSDNFDDYPLIETSYEGQRSWRCISPIYGKDLENIAITGGGTFDGNGQSWRPHKRGKLTDNQWRKLLNSGGVTDESGNVWWPSEQALKGAGTVKHLIKEGVKDKATFEQYRDFLRPCLVQLDRCKRILLDGPTFQNSPAWNLHPWCCEHITLRNLQIRNPWYSQNGDGLDLDSCRFAQIHDCHFDVGDDAICMKSGKDEDGRALGVPCEYVDIRNCVVYHGHGGFVIGSEMSGGCRNIRISDCLFIGTDTGLRFKTTRGRGGVVENIDIRNIRMLNIPEDAITFSMYYMTRGAQAPTVKPVTEETPVFRNFHFENIQCVGAHRGLAITGLPEMPVENITFNNVQLKAKNGVRLAFARNIRFNNLTVVAEEGPLFAVEDCEGIQVEPALAEDIVVLPSRLEE